MTAVATLSTLARRARQAWHEGRSDAELHHAMYSEWRRGLAELGLPAFTGCRILDVGCGDRAQASLLAAADGGEVTAIDMRLIALGWRRPWMWFSLAREDGPRAMTKAIIRDVLHTIRYWRTLSRLAGHRLPFHRVSLRRADATRLPFPDDSFDLVISSAVWEHLQDVDAATREVNRVLAKDGLAVIQIALFPALQGGHHWEWHSIDPNLSRSIRPWDHLYLDHLPYPVDLNEWREGQYREVLGRRLQILLWDDGELRGDGYLTTAIEAELDSHSRRDLLLSSVTVWATKRQIS